MKVSTMALIDDYMEAVDHVLSDNNKNAVSAD